MTNSAIFVTCCGLYWCGYYGTPHKGACVSRQTLEARREAEDAAPIPTALARLLELQGRR